MKMKNFKEKKAMQLRIYIMEKNKIKSYPAHEIILKKAIELEISGATLFRGMAGYGCSHQIHSSKLLTLSDNMPMVLEIIDSKEKIFSMVDYLDAVLPEGVFTLEEATLYSKVSV